PPPYAIYTLSLHDALPIFGDSRTVSAFGARMRSRLTTDAFVSSSRRRADAISTGWIPLRKVFANALLTARSRPFSKLSSSPTGLLRHADRLNSSHVKISYA